MSDSKTQKKPHIGIGMSDAGTSVSPHEFEPLSRFLHRRKCRHCYCGSELHPMLRWVPARPYGDKSNGLLL